MGRRPVLVGRRLLSRSLDALGVVHPWVKHRPNPSSPRPLSELKLFAVLGTWAEADVVEATTKNAFVQGCERVFLVDNDSPDDTVAAAVAAGASLARSYSTSRHVEQERIRLMNEVVEEASLADGSDHIWWLWLDADEFPHGPGGLTIREYLETLDRCFRIVGCRYLNHYPSGDPAYVTGFHPLDFQPRAEELTERRCWLWHRKHSLQRFDREGPPIVCQSGFHIASSSERPLLEPTEPIFVHHFPYRNERSTHWRLEKVLEQGAPSPRYDPKDSPTMRARQQALQAVYSQDWEAVDRSLAPGLRRPHAVPRPWTEIVGHEHHVVKRWYPDEQLSEAMAQSAAQAV